MFQHLITINNNKKTMFNHITLSVILVSFIVFYSYFELVFIFLFSVFNLILVIVLVILLSVSSFLLVLFQQIMKNVLRF